MKIEMISKRNENTGMLPPILFIHGAYHGAWCWEEYFIPYFSALGFSCYAISLRGHGHSEGRDKLHSYSLRDYKEDCVTAIGQMNERPILIGHSMGGAIVQQIMHTAPETIRAAVLLSSVPPNGMLGSLMRLFLKKTGWMFQLNAFNQTSTKKFPYPLLFNNRLSDEQTVRFAALLQPESNRVGMEMCRRIVPRIFPVQVPLLIIGSQSDNLFAEKSLRHLGKAYHVEPIIFADMCHDMMLDPNWKQAADKIATFLQEKLKVVEGKL
ncbi:alpha/beta hydrolase [Paenibacillus sp. JNUCC31]|uniref:alpha/beta hydrolase n=1 Tax=Paenibacillus sp. JNUCC-31 TaxID=2777983 RepID=UPI00177AF3B0|nr:alpha/beta hydrolase [Paenibacillus sp. JNUCC-31]QOS80432.1 alpha/beta hydrolase [Paenibacillus sp. JNUCC-31]